MSFVWLDLESILYIQEQQIAKYGGLEGVRDYDLLSSALDRPINKFNYENANIFHLSAAYAFGFSKNHPFFDGNKRAAFAASYTFLLLNGYQLTATENEAYDIIIRLAEGSLEEEELTQWFKTNSIGL